MTADKHLTDAIRARVAEIDKERDHLVALLEYYGAAPPEGRSATPPRRPSPSSQSRGRPFETRPAGPTERLIQVVDESPGMIYREVLDRAELGMDTKADNPRRSLGSTLGSLVKRGKIRKEDGKYYPVTET